MAETKGKRTVWAASSGEYSGYGVDRLFETQELAKAYCKRMNATRVNSWEDKFFVEKFGLWAELPEREIVFIAAADMDPDGHLNGPFWEREFVDVKKGPSEPREYVSAPSDQDGRITLRVRVRRSRAEAEKALHDLAARVRAERAGIA